MTATPLAAFAAFGIELEYMIVDRQTFSVRPIADALMHKLTGGYACEVERGLLAWSNELVLHVIEIKNPRPHALMPLPAAFQAEIRYIDEHLQTFNARLLPTAMHPWMNPAMETHLWPHDNQAIYQAYHRIFDCKRHGWANLQSMHVNLPFADDTDFEKLLAAVRLVLPILPAIAASSPIADGAHSGWMDFRMHVYKSNADAFPSIAGHIVPELVRNRRQHETEILTPMYADIAPLDPDHALQSEWLNSRGAIPRFDRNAIEIRVLDMQECPQADLALAGLVIDLVKLLYEQQTAPLAMQQAISTQTLAEILAGCTHRAERCIIDHPGYLALFGFPGRRCEAGELWRHLVETLAARGALHQELWRAPLQTILRDGPLARRILDALGQDVSRQNLHTVYGRLADCLLAGTLFAS